MQSIKHKPEQHGSIFYHYFYFYYSLSDNFQHRSLLHYVQKRELSGKEVMSFRSDLLLVSYPWKWFVFRVLARIAIAKVYAKIKFFFCFCLSDYGWLNPERNTFNSEYNDFQQLKPSSRKLRCGYRTIVTWVRYK